MRIVIADDHGIVRDGLRWMLVNDPSIEIVGEAASGAALLKILPDLDPDVVLLDVRMPGMSGLETLEAIRELSKTLPVLILTMHDEPELVAGAIERGANGYLLKSAEREELVRAIGEVGRGGSYLQGDLAKPLVSRMTGPGPGPAIPDLSDEDRRILGLVARGFSNKEIAGQLELSEPGVKAALQGIFKALGAHGRSEAVAIALRLDLID